MKKRIAALLLVLAAALPLVGCGMQAQELTGDITAETVNTTTELTSGGEAVSSFALSLLKHGDAGSSGTLVSPVSVLYALGMTANGASGSTLSQIEDAVGMKLADLNDFLYTYRMSLPASDKKCTVSTANSLWVRDIFRVEDDFLHACVDYYDAQVYRSAFDDTLVSDVNSWVSQNTGGLIDSLLDEEPNARAMLYLVNAAAFDAQWETPYEKEQIREGEVFTAADGSRQTADYLCSSESIYLSGNNVTGFLKYYDGGKYAFVALLPDEGITLEEYLSGLTGKTLYSLLTSHRYAAVEAAIPRFTARSELELTDVLKTAGITDLFDAASADLRGMGSAANDALYVSSVRHRTYLALDESGTKAAAATSVEVNATADEPMEDVKYVTLDRPFLYMIVDTHACIPLFMGTVTELP